MQDYCLFVTTFMGCKHKRLAHHSLSTIQYHTVVSNLPIFIVVFKSFSCKYTLFLPEMVSIYFDLVGDGGRWRPRASTVWKPPLSTHCDLQRSDLQRSDLQRSSQSDCSYTSGATKSQQGSHAPSSGILFKFAQNSKDVTGPTVVQFQSHTVRIAYCHLMLIEV